MNRNRFLMFFLAVLMVGIAGLFFTPPGRAQQPGTNSTPANAQTPSAAKESPADMLHEAYVHQARGETTAAIDLLNSLLQLDPQNVNALLLRGSIFAEKKRLAEAQHDYEAAVAIQQTNNGVARFDLAELKFMQKNYVDSRPLFVGLQTDPDVGDIAAYRVFLCDLFGGHEDVAAQELAVFNQVGSNPSYYYGNVAWDVVHHKTEDARGWLSSAFRIYSLKKNSYYTSSLNNLGYLPLPPPPNPYADLRPDVPPHNPTLFEQLSHRPRLLIGLAVMGTLFLALVGYVVWRIYKERQRKRRRRRRTNRRSRSLTDTNPEVNTDDNPEINNVDNGESVADGLDESSSEDEEKERESRRRKRRRDAY